MLPIRIPWFLIGIVLLVVISVFLVATAVSNYKAPPPVVYVCPNGDWEGYKENMTLSKDTNIKPTYGVDYDGNPTFGWTSSTLYTYRCPVCNNIIEIELH